MTTKRITEKDYVEELLVLMRDTSNLKSLQKQLDDYHDNDIAEAFEQLSVEERIAIYRVLDPERLSEIFAYIEDAGRYFEEMEQDMALDVIEEMEPDEVVDIIKDVDQEFVEKLLDSLDEENSKAIELIRSYNEDEIGSRMTTNFIKIKKGLTVKQAMRELISQAQENDNIYSVYVCEEDGVFYGVLDLKDLITSSAQVDLESLIRTNYPVFAAKEKISDCLEEMKDYAEDSIPIVDEYNKVIGVITYEELIEVVDEEMGDDYAKLAGLTEEEEINETLFTSMGKRLPWLIVLLFLGIGISSVVGLFESVVSQVAVIICFQSLILNMAGNVGTQSLAVTIRRLVDDELKTREKIQLVLKELRIGLCNGLLLGLLSVIFLGLYIAIIKGYEYPFAFVVSGCVGLSLMVAMAVSSLIGTLVPMFFNKIKIDPAVASGPLITTVNDLVAVVVYYGLVWILLL